MRTRTTKRVVSILAVLVALALVATACGDDDATTEVEEDGDTTTTAPEDDGGDTTTTAPEDGDTTTTAAPPPEVETGPGVTDDTITLGILTDLTGVFAGAGAAHVAGVQMFWDQFNEDGGACDRTVELEIQDHGYDPQRAVAAYQDVQPDILALNQVLGSPVQAAMLPLAAEDEIVMGLVGWSSSFLSNEFAVTTGATYDVQFIAGIQYLVDEGLIQEGDTIGHIYFGGDFGENGLLGSKYAAEALGLEVLEAAIDPTVTDLTAQVSSFQNGGATAILLGAAVPQLIAVVNAQIALDYNVPILGQVPAFQPTLMDNPDVWPYITEYFYAVTPTAPFGYDTPEGQLVAELFVEEAPEVPPQVDVNYVYAQAYMFGEALKLACEQGDLTRAGFNEAIHSLVDVETGLTTPLSYNVGGPAGTEVFVARPAEVPGGLMAVAEGVTSPLIDSYEFP